MAPSQHEEAKILFDPYGRSAKQGFLECKFRINNGLISSRKIENVLLIIVADRSGSMAGRPWEQVQESLLTIMEETYALDHITTRVVVYNHEAAALNLSKQNFAGRIKAVKASSLTCFSQAFDKTLKIIKQDGHNFERIVTVFMSDGCDTSKSNPDTACDEFSQSLKSLTIPSSVHVIGFSAGHNFKFLDKVRVAGSQPGVFRYAEASDGRDALRGKFEEVFDMIANKPSSLDLRVVPDRAYKWENEPTEVTVNLAEAHDEFTLVEFSGWVHLNEDLTDGGVLQFSVDTPSGAELEFVVPVIAQPTEGKAAQSMFKLKLLKKSVDELTENVGDKCKGGHDRFMLAIPEISELQEQCKRFDPFGKGIPSSKRQNLLETRFEIQSQLDDLHTLVANAMHSRAGNHSSAVLARAADIRFQGKFSKARRQRKVNQRVAKNITSQEGIEALLLALPDPDPIDLTFDDDALDFFQCTLSQGSISDILLEEKTDILGFGLAVKRPEEVIDCATLIRIFEISTTLVSYSTMSDAIKYSISVDGHLRTHGGFEVQADLGVAVRGRSREPINDFLPLYINEEHWQRVKLLIPPVVGRFTCLDALAYDEQQLHVFFLVLGSMAFRICRSSAGEREGRLLFAYARTCRQLMLDFDLHTRIQDKVKEFCESPAGRTKDKIQNLGTFLGYVLVMDPEMWDEIDWSSFWSAFLVETVRRSASVVLKGRSDATVLEIQNRLLYGNDVASDAPSVSLLQKTLQETMPMPAGGMDANNAEQQPFQGWVYANDSGNPQDVEALVQTMKFPNRNGLKALAEHGRSVAGKLPGPNIAAKASKAQTAADQWWASLLPGKETLQEFALPEKTLHPRIVTQCILQTMQELEDQVIRVTFPTFQSVQSAARCVGIFNTLRNACKETSRDVWGTLDENDGLCPSSWLDLFKGARKSKIADGHTISLSGLIKELVDPDDLIMYKRAMFLLSVEYFSNKRARTAANQGLFPTIQRDGDSAAAVLLNHHAIFEEKRAQRHEHIAEYTRWQRANMLMVNTDDIWVFIGCLARSIDDRGQAFSDLAGMLQDPSSAIPLQREKIEIILSGSYDDAPVFAKGNIWIPDNNHREAFVNAIGFDAYNEIEMRLRTTERTHVYRDSDIPNRHGHCNSNPHRPAYCRKCIAAGLGAARRWNG